MRRVANLVLYTLVAAGDTGFIRHPVASGDPEDPLSRVLISHAAMDAVSDAKKRGVPAPKLQCLLEEREANEQGVLISSAYTEVDMVSGAKIGETKLERAEHDPRTPKQTADDIAAVKARAQVEERIAKSIDAMVASALEAQQKKIQSALAEGKSVSEVFASMRAAAPAAVAEQPAKVTS